MSRPWIYVIFLVSISGCSTSYVVNIHSPSIEGGDGIRYQYAHGGVSDASPPDLIKYYPQEDSTSFMLASAQHISTERKWMSLFLIPIRFIPVHKSFIHYQNDDSLIVSLTFLSPENVSINPSLITIDYDNNIVNPSKFRELKEDYISVDYTYISPFVDVIDSSFTPGKIPESYRMQSPYGLHSILYETGIELKFPIPGKDVESFRLLVDGIFIEEVPIEIPDILFQKSTQKLIRMLPY